MSKNSSNQTQARHLARRKALQALYQWDMAGHNVGAIVRQFLETQDDMSKVDREYFEELVRGVPTHLNELDELIRPHLARAVESVDPIERCVLRLGAYELQCRIDVPYRVVINESVELSKMFGAEQGHKFVNGVLDMVAKQVRSAEQKGSRG